MTGEQVVQAAEDAAKNVIDGPRRRKMLLTAVLVAVLAAVTIGGLVWLYLSNTAQDRTIAQLETQARQNAVDAQSLAQQVRSLGGVPIVQPPQPGVKGDPGERGRGITGTTITPAGRLVIAYSDGATEDKGPVVGAKGDPGRAVTGSTLSGGDLVLLYSDGGRETVGRVLGEKGDRGRSVVSLMASTDYHLIVTYDDGSTDDVGQLPPGPPGPKGDPGRGVRRTEVIDCRWRTTYTDGVIEDSGNACTTQTVTAPPPTTTTTTRRPVLPVPR